MIKNNHNKNNGYIALISLLVVAAAALTIGVTVSLTSMSNLQMSFGSSQRVIAKDVAGSCVEDALEKLRNNWQGSTNVLPIGSDSCIIKVVTTSNLADLYATGTVGLYNQKIQVQVDNNLNILTWQED